MIYTSLGNFGKSIKIRQKIKIKKMSFKTFDF